MDNNSWLNIKAHAIASNVEKYVELCHKEELPIDHDTIAGIIFDGMIIDYD